MNSNLCICGKDLSLGNREHLASHVEVILDSDSKWRSENAVSPDPSLHYATELRDALRNEDIKDLELGKYLHAFLVTWMGYENSVSGLEYLSYLPEGFTKETFELTKLIGALAHSSN